MNVEYLSLFPVPIQITKLELNVDSLIEFCYEMKRKNEKGVEKTNIGGWQSSDIFNETHTEFVKLKHTIEEYVNIFHHDMQFKKIYNQKMANIWININQKGHSNELHNHARSIFSGAFYLTTTETTQIVFQHPFREINHNYWEHPLIEEWNFPNSSYIKLSQKPNTLLIFPSWVFHKVSINVEDTDRISFSFNTYNRQLNEIFS